MAGENTTTDVQIAEADLRKTLESLGVAPGTAPAMTAAPVTPKVVTARLTKTAGETLRTTASQPLLKSLEVSTALREIVDIMGVHIDGSLEALQKSIDESAQRDQAIVSALDRLSKAIETFGAKPVASTTRTAPLTKTAGDVINPAPAATTPAVVPGVLRKALLTVLQKKAIAEGGQPMGKYTQALAKFEGTKDISPELFSECHAEAVKDGLIKAAA